MPDTSVIRASKQPFNRLFLIVFLGTLSSKKQGEQLNESESTNLILSWRSPLRAQKLAVPVVCCKNFSNIFAEKDFKTLLNAVVSDSDPLTWFILYITSSEESTPEWTKNFFMHSGLPLIASSTFKLDRPILKWSKEIFLFVKISKITMDWIIFSFVFSC